MNKKPHIISHRPAHYIYYQNENKLNPEAELRVKK